MIHSVKMVVEMRHQNSDGSITFAGEFEVPGLLENGKRIAWHGGRLRKEITYQCVVQNQSYDLYSKVNSIEAHTVRSTRKAAQELGWLRVINDLEQSGWKICGATGSGEEIARQWSKIVDAFGQAHRVSRTLETSNFIICLREMPEMWLSIYASDAVGAWTWFNVIFGDGAQRDQWEIVPKSEFIKTRNDAYLGGIIPQR